jgi:hypothetical protein
MSGIEQNRPDTLPRRGRPHGRRVEPRLAREQIADDEAEPARMMAQR